MCLEGFAQPPSPLRVNIFPSPARGEGITYREGNVKSTSTPGSKPSSFATPALTSTAYKAGRVERYVVSWLVGTPGWGIMVWMLVIRRSLFRNRMSRGMRVSFIQKDNVRSCWKTNSIPPSGAR